MTAKEWRRTERELREHSGLSELRLPYGQGRSEGPSVRVAYDDGLWLQGGHTTDAGAILLRDWLIELFPLTREGA